MVAAETLFTLTFALEYIGHIISIEFLKEFTKSNGTFQGYFSLLVEKEYK